MPDSRRELIVKNVKTTLEGVTTGAGYQNTIASVQRFKEGGNVFSTTPLVIIGEGDEQAQDGPLPYTTKTLELFLEVTHRQDEIVDTRAADDAMNDIVADIEKALQVDTTRGGRATDTTLESCTPLAVEDGQGELVRLMRFSIEYRHPRDNPRA